MTRDDILTKVRGILCDEFGYEDGAYYVDESKRFCSDLGFEDHDLLQLTRMCEQRLGITFTEGDSGYTVGDLVDANKRKKEA